jgi:hypothetical protein
MLTTIGQVIVSPGVTLSTTIALPTFKPLSAKTDPVNIMTETNNTPTNSRIIPNFLSCKILPIFNIINILHAEITNATIINNFGSYGGAEAPP